jgi:hypothetical protein
MSAGDHRFIPNGADQPNYWVAYLSNPILGPWVVEQMKTANDTVLAGNVPSIGRERYGPAGDPAYDVHTRIERDYFVQTPKEVTISEQLDGAAHSYERSAFEEFGPQLVRRSGRPS